MTRPVRWVATVLAGATVVAAVAGCADADEVGDAERAIAGVLQERLGDEPGIVTVECPDDASFDAGSSIECGVAVGGATAQPVAFAVADGGRVELASSVLPVVAAESFLAGELAGPAAGDVEVTCGDAPLLVGDVGDTFSCRAVRAGDGTAFDVTVEIAALDGTVRYEVAATTSTTSTLLPDAG